MRTCGITVLYALGRDVQTPSEDHLKSVTGSFVATHRCNAML